MLLQYGSATIKHMGLSVNKTFFCKSISQIRLLLGDFPDRYLAGKTWLNLSEKACGDIHHFYRASLAQC